MADDIRETDLDEGAYRRSKATRKKAFKKRHKKLKRATRKNPKHNANITTFRTKQ